MANIEEIHSPPKASFIALTAEQLDGVVERFFQGQTGLVVLTIDPDKVLPPIQWEHAPDANQLFPHIYGPLNLDAVTGVAPLLPG